MTPAFLSFEAGSPQPAQHDRRRADQLGGVGGRDHLLASL